MNKIFRVVWSHAAQSWVAVSELTSAKGKTKSKTMSKLAALSLVAGAISMDVIAAETANIPAAAISTSDNGIFIGPKGKTTATAQTAGKSVKNVIIIGNRNGVADEGIVIGNDITSSASVMPLVTPVFLIMEIGLSKVRHPVIHAVILVLPHLSAISGDTRFGCIFQTLSISSQNEKGWQNRHPFFIFSRILLLS